MALDPMALELYVYLLHRDLTMRDTAPCRADPPTVGRFAERYAGRRIFVRDGETHPSLVARCAGTLIYTMDGYGLTFEEVCGLADHEVATIVAGVTPDNRLAEPIRQLKLREAVGLASELGQLVKLAEMAGFTHKILHEFVAADYLQHAQPLKRIVDRHSQLIQAMSRLTAHAAMLAIADSVRESLVKVSHNVDDARSNRTATRQPSQGREAN
jgi:hypothetical protein